MSGFNIHHGDWILVGDGERAMLLRNAGDQEFPNLEVVDLMEREGEQPPRENRADQPGLGHGGTGAHHSTGEEKPWQHIAKSDFSKEIAAALYKKAHRNKFERLFVVAPPQTLGELRHAFHKEVSARIVGELNKDLTNHPVHEIEKHLTSRPH